MNLRFLKILVTVMGVMLAGGVIALVLAVAARFSHKTAPVAAAFTAPPIELPHGSTIERTTVGADRIVLQVDLLDGSVNLVVIDVGTGRLVGTIPLREAP